VARPPPAGVARGCRERAFILYLCGVAGSCPRAALPIPPVSRRVGDTVPSVSSTRRVPSVREAEHHHPSYIPCTVLGLAAAHEPWLLQLCSPPSILLFQGVLSLVDLGSCPLPEHVWQLSEPRAFLSKRFQSSLIPQQSGSLRVNLHPPSLSHPGLRPGWVLPVPRLLRYLWASAVHVLGFHGGEGGPGWGDRSPGPAHQGLPSLTEEQICAFLCPPACAVGMG